MPAASTARIVNCLTDAPAPFVDLGRRHRVRDRQRNIALIIKSPAGEFPITIDSFQIEQSELVIVGRMGVWDARTHVGAGEFLRLLGKLLLSPAVILFTIKAPFLAARSKPGESA